IGTPDGARELARDPLEVGENAVATLGMELVDRFLEKPLIVHVDFPLPGEQLVGPPHHLRRLEFDPAAQLQCGGPYQVLLPT
ncbi:hypothetical protein, partial [Mesorhizobium sp. M7A.F.Ca.US.007.01.2.1]|uniref:hypothetical protein n=1 Tax=Mesorhizobium sp. M7A.F.Ca.US.007.01.2.1 TaxID=2496711 RepID=UPI0013E3D3EC